MTDYPKCGRLTCNNYRRGRCIALITADFGSKMCPFYCSRADTKKEDWEFHVMEENLKKGRDYHR